MLTACPSDGRLRTLLEGDLAAAEEAELAGHLDGCQACRERLEKIEQDYAVALHAVPASAAYSRARESLQDAPPVARGQVDRSVAGQADTAPTLASLSAELPSGYLQPADDPRLLGRIAHYEIIERIGNGGMGVVLKARDTRLNRIVAIKVLAPHLAASGAARQRFAREARAAAAVSHENVVTIHAVEEVGGLPLLVMQYVPGLSLREKLDQEGPLDVRRIVRIALQTAAGLAAAHAQGVIHRDIKPGNILLENGIEKVRLTDFGLATVSDDVALTQTGCLAGTPQYMAPEQIQAGTADARSDLFSLGSVMYEMCTGRGAFRGSNPYTVLHRVCQEQPRPIREINPEVPEWLAAIVDRLLQKDPQARFQSAAELVEVLRERLVQLQQPGLQGGSVFPPVAATNPPARGTPQYSFSQPLATASFAVSPAKPLPELPELLRAPTLAMVLAASLQILIGLALIGLLVAGAVFGFSDVAHSWGAVILAIPVVFVGVGVAAGQLAACMAALRTGAPGPVRIAALLACLPVSPAWLVGLPIAIWTGLRLARLDVREDPHSWGKPQQSHSSGMVVLLVVLALVVGLGLAIVFAWMNEGPPLRTARGTGTRPADRLADVSRLMLAEHPQPQPLPPFPLGPDPRLAVDLERAATGAIAFAADGNLFAIGDRDGFVRLHFVRSGEKAMTLIQSREPIRRLAFSHDGLRLAAARESAIDIWDLSKQSVLYSIEPAAEGQPAGGQKVLHFLGDKLLLCDRGKELAFFEGQSPVDSLGHPSPLASADVSADEQYVVTGDELGLVKIWKLADRSCQATFEPGSKPAQVQFLTNSLVAAACGRDVKVCNLQGNVLSEFSAPPDTLADDVPGWLAACPGDLVARVGIKPTGERRRASVLLWRWAEPALAASFEGVAAEPLGIGVDRTGRNLAIVTEQQVSLFRLKSFEERRPQIGDSSKATVLATPARAAAESSAGFDPYFLSADVTPDGRRGATGQRDGSVSVWDLSLASRIGHFNISGSPVRDVCFGPSDEYVLAGDDAGNLVLSTRQGESVWKSQVNTFFPDDRSLSVVGLGFRPPFVLYGYQSRKMDNLAGVHAQRIDQQTTLWMGSDYGSSCRDMAVSKHGTAWTIDDRNLNRERLIYEGDQSVQQDHSRRWAASGDHLGTVAVTGNGYPVVGTALPPSLSASERHELETKGCVRLIEPEEGRVLRSFSIGRGEVTALAASDWRFIAAATATDGHDYADTTASQLIVWDAQLGCEVVRWPLDERVSGLAFVPSDRGGQPAKLLVAGERLLLLPLPDVGSEAR